MSASDPSQAPPSPSSSTLETRSRRLNDRTHLDPSQASQTSRSSSSTSSTNLQTLIESEVLNVNDPNHSLDHRTNIEAPKYADETVSNPLFPPLPTHYSWPTIIFYRVLSMILSVCFLIFVVICAMLKTVPSMVWVVWCWCQLKDPDRSRPFYTLEKERKRIDSGKLKCDVRYYAQRVGLECDEMQIETEDGFILTIHHIVDRSADGIETKSTAPLFTWVLISGKYPVLLLHGLMQSTGAFCVNDENSIAFFLCKSGYDVWLGNNRGYFKPQHKSLKPSNPKFWAWNLRQMGCLDIPALVSFVCGETGRKKVRPYNSSRLHLFAAL